MIITAGNDKEKERHSEERMVALCPHTVMRIRGGWSHYTDTSEPVDGNGALNMVTVQSGFRTRDFRSLAQRAYQLR
jgi:hypothetical protein